MVQRIEEPASVNPATADWQQLLNKLNITCGHLLEVDFVIEPTFATGPKIKAGSRLEVNGSFFVVMSSDEDITGFESVPAAGSVYIYAIPNQPNFGEASSCTFNYNATIPTYNVALGGMFNGNNRAIGYLEKRTNGSYQVYAMNITPSQNVKMLGVWSIPTPALPPT